MSRLPNLFLVGSMKSGTTSLHSYLDAHPAIFMSAMKEPTYFVDADELKRVSPAIWERGYWREMSRYLELFADAGEASYVGESSTNYSKLPQVTGVAQRIAEFNPSSRILYIMRDPVERTISHYWHMARWHGESRDILHAVQQDAAYREVSHYAMQLAPYFGCFDRGQIRTLTLEKLRADPVATMGDIFSWLGVEPFATAPVAGPARNVTSREVVQVRGRGILHGIKHSRAWDLIGPMVPKRIRALGNRLSEHSVDRSKVDMAGAIEYLRPLLQAETRELTQLLGREFPEWTTLYAPAGAPNKAAV